MSQIRSGFTIVELLITIVVIGILSTTTVVGYRGIQDRSRNTATTESVHQLAEKITIWHSTTGRYPTTAEIRGGLRHSDSPESEIADSITSLIVPIDGDDVSGHGANRAITICSDNLGVYIAYYHKGSHNNYETKLVGLPNC